MPVALRWLLNLLPLNPICVRLVQGGSRRLRHLYIRSGYLAVLIVVLLLLLLPAGGEVQGFRDLARSGATAFQWVAYLQVALICILTPVFMAGAIAQESNPKNWDVLLTTPLNAVQIVLGNLFGRLFFVLALLLASLPLFAITQYFGGVPGRSVLLSYAVAAGAALLVGAIAIALAVNRLAGRRAVFTFYVAVVSYIGVTAAADWLLQASSPAGPGGVTVLTPLNPFLALRALLEPSTYIRPDAIQLADMTTLARWWFGSPVIVWVVLSIGISTLLALVSGFTLRGAANVSAGVPWYRRVFKLGASGSTTRPARDVWENPVAWREAAARAATLPKLLLRWGFIAAGLIFGIGLVLALHTNALDIPTYQAILLATVWTETIIILLVAINMSATAISREREDGTLDLLLTTPLSQTAYLNGKLRGLISYLTPLIAVPVLTVAAGSLYALMSGFGREGGVTQTASIGTGQIDVPLILPEAALLVPIAMLPFVAFCIMVGLQWSLKSRGTISSVVGTVGVAGAVAGVLGLCGWEAARDIPLVGPALAALNPVSLLYASVHPGRAMLETISQRDLTTARISLLTGAAIAVATYSIIVFAMRASMVKTFDMTTRRLAGTR